METLQQRAEFLANYESKLLELTFNSKPIINSLSVIAGDYKMFAADTSNLIVNRILNVSKPARLLPSEDEFMLIYVHVHSSSWSRLAAA